jgi:rhodanese-related sulfurtransferase
VVIWPEGTDGAPYGVLTGDTLFIGDVGRPDLLASVGVTADELARQLYHSLHERLLTLPDDTKVFPAHGAGSACGKSLSTETVSTIGEQRRSNYALAPMSEDQFVEAVTQGQSVAPLYFAFAANRNRQARELLDADVDVPMLGIDEVVAEQAKGAVVIDARDDAAFDAGHLRDSVNVGLGGRFAEYTGEVMTAGTPIVLVTEPGHEAEAKVRLARIGFDTVVGALADPTAAFLSRPDVVEQTSRLTALELIERMAAVPQLVLVDIRNPGEVEGGMIPGARHIGLPSLLQRMGELDPKPPRSCTAPAATAPPSLPASCGRRASPTCRTSAAATPPGPARRHRPREVTVMQTNQLPAISVRDAATAAANGELVLLDVREIDEWMAGHAPDAVHIAMSSVVDRVGELDRTRRIACVCRSGNRSGRVTGWLISQGSTPST